MPDAVKALKSTESARSQSFSVDGEYHKNITALAQKNAEQAVNLCADHPVIFQVIGHSEDDVPTVVQTEGHSVLGAWASWDERLGAAQPAARARQGRQAILENEPNLG
jgi:hypothetical protein